MPISEGRVNKAASTNDACDQSVTYSGIEAGDKDIEAQEDKAVGEHPETVYC